MNKRNKLMRYRVVDTENKQVAEGGGLVERRREIVREIKRYKLPDAK